MATARHLARMKMPAALLALLIAALASFPAAADGDSSGDWKSGRAVYRQTEADGNYSEFTYETRVTVSAGVMVVTANIKSDTFTVSPSPPGGRDVHTDGQVSTIALQDVDLNALKISKEELGQPPFWKVRVAANRNGAIRRVTSHDGKELGATDADSLDLFYQTEESAQKAIEAIRLLVQNAQTPRK